eukprot:365272-Chlamydomonas_euryale.AAC.7
MCHACLVPSAQNLGAPGPLWLVGHAGCGDDKDGFHAGAAVHSAMVVWLCGSAPCAQVSAPCAQVSQDRWMGGCAVGGGAYRCAFGGERAAVHFDVQRVAGGQAGGHAGVRVAVHLRVCVQSFSRSRRQEAPSTAGRWHGSVPVGGRL